LKCSKRSIKNNSKKTTQVNHIHLISTLGKLKQIQLEKLHIMKAFKPLTGLLFTAMMALFIASMCQFDPLITFAGVFVTSFLLPKGVAFMAVQKEIWTKDIIENLFKDNEFALRSFNADQYVLQGKVVHIPNAGAPSAVTKNQTVFPQAAVKRPDTEILYAIDTFYTTPRHIEAIEQFELSYDKRQSAVGEDQAALIQACMDSLLWRWAPLNTNGLLTTGAAVPASIAGGVGNRKAFDKTLLQQIKLKLDLSLIPAKGRVALLNAQHYNDFFNSLSEGEKTNFNNVADLKNGIVGRYMGFDIMMRSTVLRYRGANLAACVVVDEQDPAFAASDKTNDRGASLIYHDKSVERARGEVRMFDGVDRPEYYGDIFSFILRLGGRQRRVSGVWAVIDELTA
jgi:hypothetical protein